MKTHHNRQSKMWGWLWNHEISGNSQEFAEIISGRLTCPSGTRVLDFSGNCQAKIKIRRGKSYWKLREGNPCPTGAVKGETMNLHWCECWYFQWTDDFAEVISRRNVESDICFISAYINMQKERHKLWERTNRSWYHWLYNSCEDWQPLKWQMMLKWRHVFQAKVKSRTLSGNHDVRWGQG